MRLFLILLLSHTLKAQDLSLSTSTLNPKYAVEVLVRYIKSDDSDIKSYAIEAISKTGETKLIPILKRYLDDTNSYVVIAAAKSLWRLGDLSGIKKLYEIAQTLPNVDITKDDPLTQLKIISTNRIREKAIATIVELEGIKARDLLLKIKEEDPFGQMRDAAARELARIGYKNEIDTFYQALSSQDEEIRNQAAENLSKICPNEASKIIPFLKKERSIRVQMLLLDALRCAKITKKDEQELMKFLESQNPTLKLKSIIALLNSSNPQVISKLKEIYYDTPDIITKLTILKRLSKTKEISLTCDDIDYLNSIENNDAKRRFIEIAEIGGRCSEKYLVRYINDQDPYVAIDAATKIIEMMRRK